MSKNQLNILIIDDEIYSQQLLGSIIKKFYHCKIFASFRMIEITQILSDNKIDLITMDINMPETNGLAFIRTIKSNKDYKNIPILMVSSLSSQEIKNKCYDHNYDVAGYFSKMDILSNRNQTNPVVKYIAENIIKQS